MAWIERLRHFAAEETLPLLKALVAAPSVNPPGREELAARPLADFLERHRVRPDWQETEPGRPNLLATIAGGRTGRPLALCSHLDVVPAGDPTPRLPVQRHRRWSRSPCPCQAEHASSSGRG